MGKMIPDRSWVLCWIDLERNENCRGVSRFLEVEKSFGGRERSLIPGVKGERGEKKGG